MHTFDPKRKSNEILPAIQRVLWQLPPSLTEHVAGTLDLCIGMPVMLKNNEATELCATNGAEGVVVGWDDKTTKDKVHVLETVFVLLTSPPRNIQLPDLPENVVPMTQSAQKVECTLPNNDNTNIMHHQIRILPNFAITDYGVQGRTRPFNPVDLRMCKGHQSVYTALSRSASLEGTMILFSFNTGKITGEIARGLQREFCELEILDDITAMRYGDHPPDDMPPVDSNRCILINWYLHKFGHKHVPNNIHPALDWSKVENDALEDCHISLSFDEMIDNMKEKQKERKSKLSKRTHPKTELDLPEPPHKKPKLDEKSTSTMPVVQTTPTPYSHAGPRWNNADWSCAYDVVLFILLNVFLQHATLWTADMKGRCQYGDLLESGFNEYLAGHCSLESVRDILRDAVSQHEPRLPRHGQVLTDISSLCEELFHLNQPYASSIIQCTDCQSPPRVRKLDTLCWICY